MTFASSKQHFTHFFSCLKIEKIYIKKNNKKKKQQQQKLNELYLTNETLHNTNIVILTSKFYIFKKI